MALADKAQTIAGAVSEALQSMLEHGYVWVEVPWEWQTLRKTVENGSASFEHKVYDSGTVRVRRNKQGAILIRVTDKFTQTGGKR